MAETQGAAAALGSEFWRFSLSFYRRPGVAERCLRLQDEGGWDVNLALFCLWTGFTRGAPAEAAMTEAAALSVAWRRAAVEPIRAVRRRLKAGLAAPGAERLEIAAFREAVKRVELAAEERQQRALAPLADRCEGPRGRGPALAALESCRAALGALGHETGRLSEGEQAELWVFLLSEAEVFNVEDCAGLDVEPDAH